MIKLSYIIPAHNASSFIWQTLDSIFSLPLNPNEYEVIVIDDCSTDDTCDVIEQYRRDVLCVKFDVYPANLVFLKQPKNQRQGAARNRGIEIARGEYIAFCDADDSVVTEGVMNALAAVEKSHVDICYFDFEYEQHEGQWIRFDMPSEIRKTIMSADQYLNDYYTCYYNAPWRCLYRGDFLRLCGVRFEEGVRWEDCDWTVKVYAKAEQIQFVDGIGYRYAQNESATSRQVDAQAMAEQIKAGVRLTVFAREIEHNLPGLSKTLYEEAKYRYVIQNIRLRNVTKYNVLDMFSVYENLTDNDWKVLKSLSLPSWETMVIKHHVLTLLILSIACPLAAIGRKLVTLKRRRK